MENVSNATSTNNIDDDPIVKEIPIYLSKRLENNLYLFQYPLKLKTSKNHKMNVRKAHFKPKNQEVRIEMAIDPSSKNFDLFKAEQLARDVDGPPSGLKKSDAVFENDIVDKIMYTSTKTVKNASKYSIGVYNGKEFHITPLSGFLQIRPNFSHMDKILKRKRDVSSTNNDSEEEDESGPSNAQQVTVRFAKEDKSNKKNVETLSYKKLQEKSADEAWVECQWQDSDSAFCMVQKEKLFADSLVDSTHVMNMSKSDYIRLLVPEDKEQAQIKPSLPSNVMSLHALRELPVLEQCKLLLKDAKIIQFQQLLLLLGGVEVLPPDTLLKELSQVAVVVRGNWIVKSEILYPSNTHSAVSGVPAELMCRARDYVLYLFTKNQCIERKKISSVIRIPPEEIKEILTGMSKLHHNKVWELLLPADVDFVTKYPDVALRQNLMWQQRAKQLNEYFTDNNKEKMKRRKSKSVSEDNSKGGCVGNNIISSSNNNNSKRDSFTSDSESGNEKKSPHMSRKNNNINNNNKSNKIEHT